MKNQSHSQSNIQQTQLWQSFSILTVFKKSKIWNIILTPPSQTFCINILNNSPSPLLPNSFPQIFFRQLCKNYFAFSFSGSFTITSPTKNKSGNPVFSSFFQLKTVACSATVNGSILRSFDAGRFQFPPVHSCAGYCKCLCFPDVNEWVLTCSFLNWKPTALNQSFSASKSIDNIPLIQCNIIRSSCCSISFWVSLHSTKHLKTLFTRQVMPTLTGIRMCSYV